MTEQRKLPWDKITRCYEYSAIREDNYRSCDKPTYYTRRDLEDGYFIPEDNAHRLSALEEKLRIAMEALGKIKPHASMEDNSAVARAALEQIGKVK